MSEMLEKVAREMREKYNADFLSGGDLVPFEESKARGAWMACAIAAVKALREADNDMLQAMHEAMFVDEFTGADLPMLGAGFAAAIDSILSTQPQEER